MMSQSQAERRAAGAAVALLRQVQAVSPDRPEVLWYLGVVAARDGQREDASAIGRGCWRAAGG